MMAVASMQANAIVCRVVMRLQIVFLFRAKSDYLLYLKNGIVCITGSMWTVCLYNLLGFEFKRLGVCVENFSIVSSVGELNQRCCI